MGEISDPVGREGEPRLVSRRKSKRALSLASPSPLVATLLTASPTRGEAFGISNTESSDVLQRDATGHPKGDHKNQRK